MKIPQYTWSSPSYVLNPRINAVCPWAGPLDCESLPLYNILNYYLRTNYNCIRRILLRHKDAAIPAIRSGSSSVSPFFRQVKSHFTAQQFLAIHLQCLHIINMKISTYAMKNCSSKFIYFPWNLRCFPAQAYAPGSLHFLMPTKSITAPLKLD